MKNLSLLLLCLISSSAFAQQIEAGPIASSMINSKAMTYGVSLKAITENGFFIPINAQVGGGTQLLSVGAGQRSKLNEQLSYSIALAIAHLQLDQNIPANEENRVRISALLQNEISLELSKRVNVDFHVDIDPLHWISVLEARRKSVAEDETQVEFAQYGTRWVTSDGTMIDDPTYQPAFKTHQEYSDNIKRVQNASMSNYGVSVRIKFGK